MITILHCCLRTYPVPHGRVYAPARIIHMMLTGGAVRIEQGGDPGQVRKHSYAERCGRHAAISLAMLRSSNKTAIPGSVLDMDATIGEMVRMRVVLLVVLLVLLPVLLLVLLVLLVLLLVLLVLLVLTLFLRQSDCLNFVTAAQHTIDTVKRIAEEGKQSNKPCCAVLFC